MAAAQQPPGWWWVISKGVFCTADFPNVAAEVVANPHSHPGSGWGHSPHQAIHAHLQQCVKHMHFSVLHSDILKVTGTGIF